MRFITGPSGPLVTSVITMVASVGSSTVMIAVRMSTTIATIGVAMNGKPKPSAPWMKPETTTASVSHRITAIGRDSMAVMDVHANFVAQGRWFQVILTRFDCMKLSAMQTTTYDYIIVGAGSAG